jgi:hypothetical protein
MKRSDKITLGEMRASGVRGLLVYCSDFRCSRSTTISADRWPDPVRLSDLERLFVCKACGIRGADVRPNFDWEKKNPPARDLHTGGEAISGQFSEMPLSRSIFRAKAFVCPSVRLRMTFRPP